MAKILAEVSTKNRYDIISTMLMGVASQTRLPDALLIIDDNDNPHPNMESWYSQSQYAIQTLSNKGVKWRVIYGKQQGQHHNHETAQEVAIREGFDYVWRLDDDCFPEPNVLEVLLSKMEPKVGAVGGYIITPPAQTTTDNLTNSISEIYSPNVQWYFGAKEKEVDHLNCSFLYRPGLAHYNLDLSPVAHREETMFTYEIKRAGYKILFTPECTTWHLRAPFGGIRTGTAWMFKHDEKLFQEKLNEWGIEKEFLIYLECGLGDNLAFSNLIPELKSKHSKLVVSTGTPDVFKDMGVKIISLEEAQSRGIDKDKYSIYHWMGNNDWKGHIVDAFRKMYEEMK